MLGELAPKDLDKALFQSTSGRFIMSQAKKALSAFEDKVNAAVQQHVQKHFHNIPDHAVRIIVWPTSKYAVRIDRGPTAIIRMGLSPSNPDFFKTLKRSVDRAIHKRMYNTMAVEARCEILAREQTLRWQHMKLGFDADALPRFLRDDEVTVRVITRVEVTHKESKLREVVEFPQGKGNIVTMREVAKSRLSIAVHERENTNPMDLPIEDKLWIARTN